MQRPQTRSGQMPLPAFFAFFFTCLFFSAGRLSAQVGWCSPKEAQWGETLTLYYNTKATGATFSTRDAVYAKIYLTMSDGSMQDTCLKMSARGDTMIAFLRIADSVATGGCSFETPEQSGKAGGSFIALRRDSVPARGAALSKIWNDSAAFSKERQNYPDNYRAYPEKWQYLQYAKKLDSATLHREIRQDVQFLESVSTPSAELFAALAQGYEKLGEKEKRYASLERLAQEYPLAPASIAALTRFGYSDKGDSLANRVRALNRNILARYPESKFARAYIDAAYYDTVLTTTTLKPVVEAWIHDEPRNPTPYFKYLIRQTEEKISSDVAARYAQELTEILANPELAVKYSFNNSLFKTHYYKIIAKSFILSGKYGQAISTLKVGQTLTSESDALAGLYELEGSVWRDVLQYNLSERAFVSAHAFGSKTAKDSLLQVYQLLRGSDSGFAAFLKHKADSIAQLQKTPAPLFTAKGIDGKTYDLAKLKGKVVVMNFWFIGCAPCRVEIPGLNTLTKEFARKDVVFLALALDEEKDLRDFLKKTPFSYAIISKSFDVANAYNVSGYPTHVVIDRNGMVAGRLIGGSENRHEDLRPLIARALE